MCGKFRCPFISVVDIWIIISLIKLNETIITQCNFSISPIFKFSLEYLKKNQNRAFFIGVILCK